MNACANALAACGIRREVPADGEIAPSTERLAKADVSLQGEPYAYREEAAGGSRVRARSKR